MCHNMSSCFKSYVDAYSLNFVNIFNNFYSQNFENRELNLYCYNYLKFWHFRINYYHCFFDFKFQKLYYYRYYFNLIIFLQNFRSLPYLIFIFILF